MARPAGQRCLVIAANGITVSRQRNGRTLHYFPSALPNGARTKEVAAGSHVYCILDCIFHEVQPNLMFPSFKCSCEFGIWYPQILYVLHLHPICVSYILADGIFYKRSFMDCVFFVHIKTYLLI